MPRASLLRSLMLKRWYHPTLHVEQPRGQLTVHSRLLKVPLPVAFGRTAVGTRLARASAKLKRYGLRLGIGRSRPRSSRTLGGILRTKDVRWPMLSGERAHVLRHREERPDVAPYPGDRNDRSLRTAYENDGLHRETDEVHDLRRCRRYRFRSFTRKMGADRRSDSESPAQQDWEVARTAKGSEASVSGGMKRWQLQLCLLQGDEIATRCPRSFARTRKVTYPLVVANNVYRLRVCSPLSRSGRSPL